MQTFIIQLFDFLRLSLELDKLKIIYLLRVLYPSIMIYCSEKKALSHSISSLKYRTFNLSTSLAIL